MRFLYLIGVGQALLIGVTLGEDTPPNPYQIFAEEQPQIYPTQTNQSSRIQGDRLPDLSGRPSALRPGPIPARVRYSFAADASMTEAANLLTNHFCGSPRAEDLLCGKTLVVHPGAWMDLKPAGSFGKKSAKEWGFLVWDGKVNRNLTGMVLRDREELKEVEAYIRREVQVGGGADVHALSSAEMRKWWIFIGFDIQEPTLVLETNDKKRQFIFGFVGKQVVVLDELNKLPDLQVASPQ